MEAKPVQKEGVRKVDIGGPSVSQKVSLPIFSFQYEEVQQEEIITYVHTNIKPSGSVQSGEYLFKVDLTWELSSETLY